MAIEGISRVLSRIDEIQSRIKNLMGPMNQTQNFSSALSEAENNSSTPTQNAPENIKPLIEAAAAKYNISPQVIESMARHESSFNPRAVSPKGAMGIMQIMPDTQNMLGVTDPFDPAQSIDGGAKYLRMMLDRFGGDMPKALAAYNAGPDSVSRYNGIPPYQETRNYVGKILSDIGASEDE
ncbi:TPA: hypothetical protein DEF17_05500 [bacterium]|nr:MAG: hypothetical protein AUJ18_10070 [Candidatus Hydrogenedentes bacterium CG1_02_42_14]PIU48101.1 MAG: hypothetical protein COS94_03940 [Candidatus Hydrogenedentes bacterium CG07_land_8_20_14_0_80_42_17]HBW47369.1 hypothetical protein [bacterium]